MRFPPHAIARWTRLGLLAGGLLLPALARAQTPIGGTVTGGFKFPGYDQQQRLRSLVAGQSFKTGTNFNDVFIELLRIEMYHEDGSVEFVAEAPQCYFNIGTRTASSSGPMRAFTADQRLKIAGTGFVYQQTNSSFELSNDVRTLIRREATNAPAAAAEPPLEITAAHFQFDLAGRSAVYRDRVRAEDAQMELTCGLLTVKLSEKGGSFETITAVENVVMTGKADGRQALAERAVYTRATEQVELSGSPSWRQARREGRAEKIVFHRNDKSIDSEGNVALKLPRDSFGESGFLLSAAPTNVVTNAVQFVEVFCDQLHTRSNLTIAQGAVRVLDATNRLSCGRLTLQSATSESPEVTAVAEENVVVEQGARRVTGDKAVYARAADTAVFTGHPRWALEQSEGSADLLIFRPRTNAFQASGNALVKLQRGGQGASLLPGFPAPGRMTNANASSPVEIRAEHFEVQERVATFTGAVSARETPATGAEPRLSCAKLEVQFAANTSHAETVTATGGVVMEQGTPGVTNGPAAYQKLEAAAMTSRMNPATGELRELTAEGGVHLEQPGGRAAGEQAIFDMASETVKLTGSPTAETPQLIVTEAQALLWDRASNRFSGTAPYKMKFRSSLAKQDATKK